MSETTDRCPPVTVVLHGEYYAPHFADCDAPCTGLAHDTLPGLLEYLGGLGCPQVTISEAVLRQHRRQWLEWTQEAGRESAGDLRAQVLRILEG